MGMDDFPIWRRPRHYMDVPDAHNHVHWVELFFDLIHVVTIFVLGNYLSHHLTWPGFLVFTGLYLTIFYAWADNAVYNSLYISTDMAHRATMAVQIVTMIVIAASIPDVAGKGWMYFALGYALNRALTAHMYWRARTRGGAACGLAREQGRNFFGYPEWSVGRSSSLKVASSPEAGIDCGTAWRDNSFVNRNGVLHVAILERDPKPLAGLRA